MSLTDDIIIIDKITNHHTVKNGNSRSLSRDPTFWNSNNNL